MKILIIDDELVSRKKLQKIMEISYECVAVDNGQEGLDIAMSVAPPDLILLDICMPAMDGFTVCKRLKSNLKTKNIPIIFLTAHTDMENLTKGFDLGAADYITKPFQKPNVLARVSTHLSIMKMRKELALKNALLENQLNEIKEKTQEIREKDLKLIEMDRMTGIGTFAAGIAHEINNPLNVLTGNLFLLKRDMSDLVDLVNEFSTLSLPANLLEEMEKLKENKDFLYLTENLDKKFLRDQNSLERMQKIVQELRDFSYIDTQEATILDINKNIENVLKVTSKENRENITIKKEFDKIPEMNGNGKQINQAFANIILNALQAMENGGVLDIKTSCNNEHFLITFADNGLGMTPEVLKQAFNPFFTTRPVGSGTGIGLSIVEKVVKRHNGTINITSEINKGTTVSITFPTPKRTQE